MLVSLDAIVAEACRRRFYRFILEFWETIEAVELVPNWHMEVMADELQEVLEAWERCESQPDTLINVPPGTSKSTTVSQLFAAWCWVRNPQMRIIGSSYAAPLSIGHAVKSRLCLKSDKFQRLYPGLIDFQQDQDGKTDYRNTRFGQRYSTSTAGAVTGIHGDCIIIDDPIKPDEASSEAGLAAASAHLKTLATRKTDKARSFTILLMQRLNEKDPAGEWLASGKPLRHLCLPGELPSDPAKAEALVRPVSLISRYTDGLLDSRRLPRAVLDGFKLSLGSYGYAGQIMQMPSPEEGGLLKKAWFKIMSWDAFNALPGGKVWHFDADTAYTDESKNDPSALLASCYLGQTLYVRLATEMRLEFPALKVRLQELVKLHGYTTMSKFYVEPKASGKSVVQELRSISQLNVVEAPAPMGKKLERVNAASPFIEAGRVVLLDGSWNEAFISQAAGFPTAAHDDMLDCLTQAIARYNKPVSGGTTFGF